MIMLGGDRKKLAAAIIASAEPKKVEVEAEYEAPEGSDLNAKLECASEVMKAIHSKDVKALCDALEAFFHCVDAEPHKEGEHI